MKILKSFLRTNSFFQLITFGIVTILFIVVASTISLKNSYEENLIKTNKIKHSLQEHSLVLVSQLHRIAEDKALTQGSEWNLQNTVLQGLQREIRPGGFSFIEIVDAQCKAMTKTQGESNAPSCNPDDLAKDRLKAMTAKDGTPALVAIVPFQKTFFLRGTAYLGQEFETTTPSAISAAMIRMGSFVRVDFEKEIVLLSGLLFLLTVLFSSKTKALNAILAHEHKELIQTREKCSQLEQLNSEFKSKQTDLERLLKDSRDLATKLERDNQHMGRFEAFADEISRSYLTLQKKSDEWQEHLDDILQIIQDHASKHAGDASSITDRWSDGVRQGANSELGARRYFKLLVETLDPTTGKNHLESDLTFLSESIEQLKDQLIHVSLQLAALKSASASSANLVTHWSQLINQTDGIEQKPGDLLRSYRSAEQMVRFETQYSNVNLSAPVLVGSLGFKSPNVSDPVLTSLFYHLILFVLYQTEQTTTGRAIRTYLKSSGNIHKFIINCSTEGAMMLSSQSESARQQWKIIAHLAKLSSLTVEMIPPTQGLYAVALRWNSDLKERKTSESAQLPQ